MTAFSDNSSESCPHRAKKNLSSTASSAACTAASFSPRRHSRAYRLAKNRPSAAEQRKLQRAKGKEGAASALYRDSCKKVAEVSAGIGRKVRSVREYMLGEEIANSVTHGVGALLAIAALVILIVRAVGHGGGIYLFAALLYAITMLLEYLMSTLYHALTNETAKRVFKVLDHSCIYLYIAGSYTPFCLITLNADGGIWLCVFVWAVALAGVACEAFWVFRPRWISAVLYLLLGWSVIWFLPALIANLSSVGLWLLIGGGVCYSIGCIFYILKKVPYMHSVFHVWVLLGSVLQFLAIVLYVM